MEAKDIISSGLLELFVLGLANEQETAEVIALARLHPEVAEEIKAIESGLEHYAQAHAIQPRDAVKESILNKIQASANKTITSDGAPAKVVTLSSGWKYAAAAAIILLLGSIVLNMIYYNKYKAAYNDYTAAVEEKNHAQDQVASLQRSNDEMKTDMNVIQSRYSEPVALHGLEAAPEAAAKIFWMKNTGDVYIDPSNLPDAPAGKQYQLWGIVDGKPVDGGLIVTSKKGDKYRIQKMKAFGKAEAFAVTLESEGGNPTPKGDMYVMGKM